MGKDGEDPGPQREVQPPAPWKARWFGAIYAATAVTVVSLEWLWFLTSDIIGAPIAFGILIAVFPTSLLALPLIADDQFLLGLVVALLQPLIVFVVCELIDTSRHRSSEGR
jgi:hypothetical protein